MGFRGNVLAADHKGNKAVRGLYLVWSAEIHLRGITMRYRLSTD